MKTKFNIEEHAEVFGGKFQHQISDEPKSGLIRVIDYYGANISQRYKIIEHDADMLYFNKKGEYLEKFTEKVQQRGRDWKVDNSYEVLQRDVNTGKPLTGEEEQELKAPAFDYFSEIVFSAPASMKTIIETSIDLDDSNKLFD